MLKQDVPVPLFVCVLFALICGCTYVEQPSDSQKPDDTMWRLVCLYTDRVDHWFADNG